ncbi:hypothetical protein MCAG_05182 [Micromonospora sp. ATCC 39149]|uniref:Alpha/beta hydrolase n=1 Tax=Micromonospora carbonacea TaxID=47853 RepID=A0A7D6GGU1_9ACTN|nr:alpha/beta hydrolase [Micromonospora sp. ATCC 39149]EEP74855.1 hypothetical protein MCAG_05182 [Micromonospora sp. ATCC 39149]QLK00627.1 alpha/beta hydrolase [Micromonospora carbonacea]
MKPTLEVLRDGPTSAAVGPPLLLVHGGYFAAWCWENFQPYLADRGYASYAPSLRGHGGSPGIERIDSFRTAEYVADVVSVLETIDEPPVLVGHSMGGGLVQRVVAEHGDRVRGAVLLSSLPPDGFSKGAAFGWLRSGMRPLMQLSKLHRGKLPPDAPDSPETFPYSCFFHGDLPAERLASYGRRMQRESQRAGKELTRRVVRDPGAIRVPIAVIAGAEDWFFPPVVAERTARAYGVEPILVPGTGHAAMLDTGWEEVAEHILAFLPRCVTR